MKKLKDTKWKYIIINIIGILIFLLMSLILNDGDDELSTLLTFSFMFFGLVSIIDTIKTKNTKDYALITFLMSIVIAILIFIYYAIQSMIWQKTGRVEYSTSGFIAWKTDSTWLMLGGFMGFVLTLLCGSIASIYIKIISLITNKWKNRKTNKGEKDENI